MTKITIKELYRGDKYSIMGEVAKWALLHGIDERTADGQTRIEMEIVRQTLIAVNKMKENDDCIAEEELGDVAAVSLCGGANNEYNWGIMARQH